MKYPMINKQPRREVNVPELSGGLNLRDSLTGIRDNQMTDCVNMWYKNGMLRTRPTVINKVEAVLNDEATEIADYKIKKHNAYFKDQQLVSIRYKNLDKQYIGFMFVSKDNVQTLPQIVTDAEEYFVVLFGSELYCYTSMRNIFKLKLPCENEHEWTKMTADDMYVPVYMTNGRAGKSYYSYEATMFESVNLIGNKVKYYYSTVNPGVTDDGKCIMLYEFPIMKVNWISHISATITNAKGERTTHEITTNGDEIITYFESKHNSNWSKDTDGLEMIVQVDRTKIGNITRFAVGFRYADSTKGENHSINGWALIPQNAECIENNLEVVVAYESLEEDEKTKEKIFLMTRTEWFGGTSNGINGGTRLFLGGNTSDGERSLIVWSALNNPLYFPENNYAYVGDSASAVVGFGKQSNMLVIFKENETYYTKYVQNDNITAEDIINQSVVDYQASSVYFPITLINAEIGCGCAETIQLCRNRLVWADLDGKIYTLVTNNQYSERNIYEIGEMIEQRLKAESNLKDAFSCDWEGCYVLLVGGHIYVMDYNSDGYQYVYSYQKNEDANIRIPWYYWELPECTLNTVAFVTDGLLKIGYAEFLQGVNLLCRWLTLGESAEQKDEVVKSMLVSKLFEFSAGNYLKNIDRISIGIGKNGVVPIKISFVSDVGVESETVILNALNRNEREANFITVKNFHPTTRAVRTFGVKIECEGPLCIDGLSVQYRLLGGVK